ncbi:putative methyltransferase [Rosa chinensis]|uniref:Putative methyltransferase n=1 Tax=Rosa chinensis TaxID=74649 RepID=A0A2P6SAC3_ROSCH|nr:putative methyltransferase [Rosa chinensis]
MGKPHQDLAVTYPKIFDVRSIFEGSYELCILTSILFYFCAIEIPCKLKWFGELDNICTSNSDQVDNDFLFFAAQTFDLVTMKPDEVDFTASVVLEPNCDGATSGSNDLKSETTWCYGVVLWFETGFTSRFCKEKPAVLSTSPYTPQTHWMQTILTFQEPIAVTSGESCMDRSAAVGTEVCPAARIQLCISIARASQHRNIDISLETTGIDPHSRKHSWPVQLFNLS